VLSQIKGRNKLIVVMLAFSMAVAGCVSIPPEHPTEGIRSAELAAHVNFLAQTRLAGRKPGTIGSRIARQYIVERFKAYGLVPWRGEKDYVQSFGYGNNIIGVLPGSDTNLSSEFVLVSAHYDHVGKEHGKICRGAADNASGVAALLETAKQMSLYEQRPKRSVVFAAFDAEEMMLLGSFAFTCRPDVEEARIVAVVNMDILGRDFMDVVQNTVFVTGTEQYPAIREQIFRSGTNVGVDVRPIGTDLIGPRGDHVAFEERPIPCMFFSSGMYGDYHKPTDTPDKLNYAAIERSTKIVFETVKTLVSCGQINCTPLTTECDPEELRTIQKVVTELSSKTGQAGIKKEESALFKKLASETDGLAKSGQYNTTAREKLIAEVSGAMAPSFMSFDGSENSEQQKYLAVAIPFLHQHYVEHKAEWLQGCRQVVRQILKYRPSLIRNMPKFSYEIATITDDDISLVDRGDGQYALHVLFNPASVTVEKGFLGFSGGLYLSIECIDIEGTREQLADFCLLRLRRDRSNARHFKEIAKVMRVVTGTEVKGNYASLLAARLKQGGFKNETEWLVHCMLSSSPELAIAATWSAFSKKDGQVRDAACKMMVDHTLRPDVRAAAIDLAVRSKEKKPLLEICKVLDDATPAYRKDTAAVFQNDYPFPRAQGVLQPLYEETFKSGGDSKKTIGELAATRLKTATKKDFRNNRQAWEKWIEANVK
jgi:hypothetical protein